VVPTVGGHDRFPPGALDEQLAGIAADIALQLVDRSPWSTPQSPHRLDRRRKQPTIRNRHISARGDATHSVVGGGPPPSQDRHPGWNSISLDASMPSGQCSSAAYHCEVAEET
jgi:hypothetical protein